MRIWVVGTTGSGKTTFARKVETRLGIPRVEMDAITWGPGWQGLDKADRPEFERRVLAATSGDSWVCDGNYTMHDLMLPRATHVVWLDYSRARIMYRVIKRSIIHALNGRELWSGNREDWRRWLNADHPIRWAWSTHARRRKRYDERLSGGAVAHATVWRLRKPSEAHACLDALAAEWATRGRPLGAASPIETLTLPR